MKSLPRLVGLTFWVGICLSFVAERAVLGQAVPHQPVATELELIATNGAGVEKHLFSHDGVVNQLVVKPNEAVPVTLQFPLEKAGTRVAVGSLDGGEVAGNDLILPTGKLIFTFRGQSPGLYRLLVQLPAEQYRLEIYVIDPNRPRNPRLRTSH
jgi:hypothetical protein